jgi:hypothetical protein
MRFEFLGKSFVYKGHTYVKGDIVESRTQLNVVFRNLFILVKEPANTTAAPAPVVKEIPKDTKPETLVEVLVPGKEVTTSFKDAVEQDFRVFVHDRKYFVYDKDDLSKPLSVGMKKADVAPFILERLRK